MSMNFDDLNKIILSGASLCLGAFFGVLRSKLMATNEKNNFHIYFYIFSILVFTGSLLTLIINWKSIFKPDWFSIIIYLMALIGSVLLLWVTNKYLVKKDRYLTEELAPKMNEFTGNADKAQIKLICGDMDFFGSSISDIDRNVQYSYLKQQQFHNILILCRQPNNGEQRVRYGKILAELGNVEIRYYRPSPQADLSIRGRIAKQLKQIQETQEEHYTIIYGV